MKNIEISINPLAEFLEATDSRKKRIIIEQLDPDPIRIPYYQKARATIKKAVLSNNDYSVVDDGIKFIKNKEVVKDWQKNDKTNSIRALDLWGGMNLPEKFTKYPMEIVSTKAKFLSLYGIEIKVSPTGIFRIEIDGQAYIGGFKVHISKGKPFNIKQSALVAQLLKVFLDNHVVGENEIVDPQLCICIDPFSGTIVSASNKIKYGMSQLKTACQEISSLHEEKILEKSIKVA